MMKAKVGFNHLNKTGYYVSSCDEGTGDPCYLRSDLTWHSSMAPNCGTYYQQKKDAQALCDKWNNQNKKPTIWRDMTPEEKGALLLADYEGKVIEALDPNLKGDTWEQWCDFIDGLAYRIKPEPKRETVALHGRGCDWKQAEQTCPLDTHRITFDIINGEPDCASIKMERIDE